MPGLTDSKDLFNEGFFFKLESQGNVFSSTLLQFCNGISEILVASCKEKVYSIEYSDGKMSMDEVSFKGIPDGADIVSLDSFRSDDCLNHFDVALTYIKKNASSDVEPKKYLSIYSTSTAFGSLKRTIDNGQHIELGFHPYFLCHTQINKDDILQNVFLLSCGDGQINLFSRHNDDDKDSKEPDFRRISTHEYFPEFSQVSEITLRIDILNSPTQKQRCSALCCENGDVYLFCVDLSSTEPRITSRRTIGFDFPTSSVVLFNNEVDAFHIDSILATNQPQIFNQLENMEPNEQNPSLTIEPSSTSINKTNDADFSEKTKAVFANTLECCYISSFAVESDEDHCLEDSELFDVVTCCLACDIDFDGCREVLVGTYGQKVLIYKEDATADEWRLHHTLHLPSAVLSLHYSDMIGYGLRQLIVVTTMGVHVFQHTFDAISTMVARRIGTFEDVSQER